MRCGHVLFAALLGVAASCTFHAGDLCEADDCGVGGAPTARIRGVDGDGNVKVGAGTGVLLSAADSDDPDGDALGFAWTVSSDCTANVVGALDAVELALVNLAPGSGCTVTLTVSDGQHTASTRAALLVRNVGAYVSTVAPCIATFDDANAEAQGTPTTPFCSMREGLTVAATYQLAEVSLANDGPHQLTSSLVIDRSVTIRGGYVRVNGPWTLQPSGRTEIQLVASVDTSQDVALRAVAAAANDVVTLRNVSVFRAVACGHACALVDAVATNLVLSDVDLGASQRGTSVVRQASATEPYYSLRVTGTGDLGNRRQLTVNNVAIQGASAGYSSIGIAITDAVDALIGKTTITESAHTVTAVKILRAGDVRIEATTISSMSDAATLDAARALDSIAIGVIDGDSDTVTTGACADNGGGACGSSERVTIASSTITVSRARLGIGVGAYGTGRLAFEAASSSQHSTISVSARQATGLTTVATGRAELAQPGMTGGFLSVTASSTASTGLPAAFAYGWSDGIESNNLAVVAFGSYQPSLANAQITVNVGTQDVTECSGVVWRDTTQASLEGSTITVDSSGSSLPADGWTVGRVAGVRLLRAHGASLAGATVHMGKLESSWTSGALLDGQMNDTNDDLARNALGRTYGSTAVDVSSSTFDGVLSVHHVSNTPLRACIGLFGTVGASIAESSVACRMGASEGESAPTMGGIVLLQTREVLVNDAHVTIVADSATAAARVIGIQDGSRLSSLLGSSGLRITRSIIDVNAVSALNVGVRLSGTFDSSLAAAGDTLALTLPNLSGPFTPTPPLVDNNVIHLGGAVGNIGALVTSSGATLAFNSVRVDACAASCTQAYGTGFYLLQITQSAPVRLLGNGFSVPNASYGDASASVTPAVTEDVGFTASPHVYAITDNLFGYEAAGGNAALYVQVSGAGTDPVSPQGSPTLDEAALNASGSTLAIGNVAAAPLYCSDGLHGAPNGPQMSVVTHVDASVFGGAGLADIDAESISLPGADAGADAINGPCPP